MKYWLMRKNEIITLIDFDEATGTLLKFTKDYNMDIAPLSYQASKNDHLKKWWHDRKVPLGQGVVHQTLMEMDLVNQEEYLLNNLGLSLNDYYWIRPVDSTLKWEQVNLFDNDFKEDLLQKLDKNCGYKNGSFTSLSPNSSLQGQLEKTWKIKNGKRILVKGNSNENSFESLNEVFATMLHQKQGYDNYATYKLTKIKNKPYKYGCCVENFVNQDREYVSAWAIITSEKQSNSTNSYEHLIAVAAKHGIDEKQFRKDLEYQIMTDFIISNRDRHMNNIAVLRDAKTLQFIRMAPIYDSGKSMFVNKMGIKYSGIINSEVSSFFNTEEKLLALVTDKSLVDVSRLPTANDLAKLYQKDESVTPEYIDEVCNKYEMKIEAFKKWQNE